MAFVALQHRNGRDVYFLTRSFQLFLAHGRPSPYGVLSPSYKPTFAKTHKHTQTHTNTHTHTHTHTHLQVYTHTCEYVCACRCGYVIHAHIYLYTQKYTFICILPLYTPIVRIHLDTTTTRIKRASAHNGTHAHPSQIQKSNTHTPTHAHTYLCILYIVYKYT